MRTSVIFNIDPQLKSEAEQIARKQGTSRSIALSEATRAFVDDQLVMGIDRDIVEHIALARVEFEESTGNFPAARASHSPDKQSGIKTAENAGP
jgi:hypothetical protein